MDPVASAGSAAAMVSRNLAGLSASIAAAGQDPSAAVLASQAQAGAASGFSMGVLKRVLAIEASTGAQLAQMVEGGPGIDLYG